MKTLRRHARAIFEAALRAADPEAAVLRHLQPLPKARRIFVVGAGKATAPMAMAVEKALGGRITAGLIVVKDGHTAPLLRIEQREASHPVPDRRGAEAARDIAKMAAQAAAGDLVICLISGGASALLPLPAAGVTLAQKQRITRMLLRRGADITEINAVRKHLSRIKGGQLARIAAPARIVSLLLSDVVGDDLSTIGSGPTAPDSSTLETMRGVLAKYHVDTPLPELAETPKPGDPIFRRVENRIAGSNRQSIEAAAEIARTLGYRPLILSTTIAGETRDVARMHAQIALEVRRAGHPAQAPLCLLSGGETTVTLQGNGKGGRNQEFALAAAIDLDGSRNILALSAGTDGTDGPTDAAGGFADGKTVERGEARGMDARDYLDRNDAYPFLQATDDLLITGPTRTNVMDIRILLVAKPTGA